MIDTEVAGDPSAVRTAAGWLRETLKVGLADAADEQQAARNHAGGQWEGESGSSYQALTRDLLEMTDKHECRVERAATSLEEYAAKLSALESAMSGIRQRAREGGLTVAGTVIHPPAAATMGPFEPGSAAETAAHEAVARIEVWNTLVIQAADDYRIFTEWVDAQMPPKVRDALEKDGSDRLLDTVGDLFPNAAAGVGVGLMGNRLLQLSEDYRARAAEFRRRSRVSGDPRVRGRATTPAGRASIAGGLAVTGLVAAGVVSAPALAVVLAAGGVAALAPWGVGEICDNWDDITDGVGDAWDSATDAIGDTWDSVTPW